jgi:hypothetical protein
MVLGIGIAAITVLTVTLICVLRADLKKAKRGEESKFWEVDKK